MIWKRQHVHGPCILYDVFLKDITWYVIERHVVWIDPYVNQTNIIHDPVRQSVNHHRTNVHEESTWQVCIVLEVIHTYKTDLNIEHRHILILSLYQTQCNLIREMLLETFPEIYPHNNRDPVLLLD